MTPLQRDAVRSVFSRVGVNEFHHGDCVGADAEAHEIAGDFLLPVRRVIHPPTDPKFRAFCDGEEVLPEKDYLERNRDIVDWVQLMVACPGENDEVLRSGTWATIRYAEKVGRELFVIFPDGQRYWRQGNALREMEAALPGSLEAFGINEEGEAMRTHL